MRKKIGTILDDELVRRAKLAAASDGIPVSRIMETALREYLDKRKGPKLGSVAESMFGAIPADISLVKAIMEEPSAIDVG